MKKNIEMARNGDYTTGNLLDFSYHRSYSKLTDTDLLRQANANIPRQVNFTGKLWCNNVFYYWKAAKNNSIFFFRFIYCYRII